MTSKSEEKSIYYQLKQILDSEGKDDLLSELKERARNIDIDQRENFQDVLLKLASEKGFRVKRTIIYDTLASLESLWNENIPKRNLVKKFERAYREGKYEEAGQICSELIQQGLDYLGEVELPRGKLRPIDIEENQYVLHYNNSVLSFLNLDLEVIKKIDTPEDTKIIDVLPPNKYAPEDGQDVDKKIWILNENKEGERTIVSMDVEDKKLDTDEISVEKKLNGAEQLSRFQGHLLLVSKESISYYAENREWKKWFKTEKEITCTESTNMFYWVGLSDGNVRILKDLEHLGIRRNMKPLLNAIQSISSSNRIIAISSENSVNTKSIKNIQIIDPIQIPVRIIKTIILNNETIATHLANGMLIGRTIKEGHVEWQINQEHTFNSLFVLRNRIYCFKNSGRIATFYIPDMNRIVKFLEAKGINITERPIEAEPEAPIRDISEFFGREKIMQNIKNAHDFHFMISGGPKIGKTSLLNILGDFLSDNSIRCYIDMKHLIDESDSYDDFEEKFVIKCLSQHALKLEDLQFGTNYQRLRAMIRKIRGSRKYCLFCLDNFSLPQEIKTDTEWGKRFNGFMRDLFIHPNSRMILTCRRKTKNEIEQYFREIESNVPGHRFMRQCLLSIFSESEAVNAIKEITRLNQEEVKNLYEYTGRFPHLIKLYKNFEKSSGDIDVYSKKIAEKSCENIFDYFRELTPEARLLLATMLHKNLLSKKIGISNFYNDIPLLRDLIPQSLLKSALKEISEYNGGFIVEYDGNGFLINFPNEAFLFGEASKHIPWLKAFISLFNFSANPCYTSADEIKKSYRLAARISLDADELVEDWLKQDKDKYFSDLKKQYKDEFYVRKITEEGRQALGLPLVSFIIMPLRPWVKRKTIKDFNALYNSMREHVRRSRTPGIDGQVSTKFYILLFEFLGANCISIQNEFRGIERVSIIDTYRMKNILLDNDPLLRSSEEIFRQLNISERSPYTTAGAVQELFFGRELEIALIRGLPENIGIFGPRTIGKTSLMLKLHRDIKNQKGWEVYALDCSGIENETVLLKNLAEKMGIDFKKIANMEKFRKYVTKKAEEDKVQYLFLLDEVDGLVAYDTQNEEKIFKTFNRMCNELLSSGKPAARFIIFGFQQMYEQMNNPKSRLFNFMVFLPLGALDKESAFSLVTSPMKEIHIKWKDENDAYYLIGNCSCYPLLLQAACHTLLGILDAKAKNRDIIERSDIDLVFTQERFLHLCMRFYDPIVKESLKPKGLLGRLKKSVAWKREPFFEDIHKITILAAVRLYFEEEKEKFTLTEIQKELKMFQIEFPPGLMIKIIDRLRLNGSFRLIGEPSIISNRDEKIQKDIQQKIQQAENRDERLFADFKVNKPEVYSEQNETLPKFEYEFGIKIFPKLLIAKFDGIGNSKKELKTLVAKKTWEDWVRRNV